MAFSLLHSWLLSPGSLMRTLVTQFSFVQHLPFWVLLLILLNAFISQCRREQRLISQWGCVVVVLSHSLLVAGQLGQPLWSVQVAVAEGKVSPEMNRPATRTSATSLLSHFIGQSESRDWAWLPRGREIQFSSWEWRESRYWWWILPPPCSLFVPWLIVAVSCCGAPLFLSVMVLIVEFILSRGLKSSWKLMSPKLLPPIFISLLNFTLSKCTSIQVLAIQDVTLRAAWKSEKVR